MVIMLKGENGKNVIAAVKRRIASLHLPTGIKLVPFYDQSVVIDGTINTVKRNLFEGFVLVTAILFLFLRNVRSALITASIIPLSMLFSFLNMLTSGVVELSVRVERSSLARYGLNVTDVEQAIEAGASGSSRRFSMVRSATQSPYDCLSVIAAIPTLFATFYSTLQTVRRYLSVRSRV